MDGPTLTAQISLSTTFAQTAVGVPIGSYEYTRSSNPNR
jgi:cystathionine gamma-lyase